MRVESVRLLTGEAGRDFVIPGRSVQEVFSARLMDGSTTLEVGWTASRSVRMLVNRLSKVQRLAGGSGSFTRIIGMASDDFREMIESGRFDVQELVRLLGQRLGGRWQVDVAPRPNSVPPTWDITATQIEG